jgi:hypothetical protein
MKPNSEYLYTKGNEFSLNGQNYIGEYHYENMTPTTEPELGGGIVLRKRYTNLDHYTYDKLLKFDTLVSSFISPKPYMPIISNQTYVAGYVTRYFVEKINDSQSYPIEIDLSQFKKFGKRGGIDSGLYNVASVSWKLTGLIVDIIAYNQEEIFFASDKVPKIAYGVRNYTEYARIV